jgi:hypothetical protein
MLAGMKIVRLNREPASKNFDCPFDDVLLCAQKRRPEYQPTFPI